MVLVFFSKKWENNMRNPMRYGQSIITDSAVYVNPKNGKKLYLEKMAEKVITQINKLIKNKSHHFHFNNHRTKENSSKHKEQRKSATYYSLYKQGIPAFGVETSKSLSLEDKVLHHNLAINAFMELLDIIPETPAIQLDPPRLRYIVVSVNNNMPVVLENRKTLYINKGDTILISHVESNYERGLVADILDYGMVNDLRKKIRIKKSTKIRVRKDHYLCGSVNIMIKDKKSSLRAKGNENSDLLFFKVKINGEEHYFQNNARVNVIKGDTFELIDVVTGLADSSEFRVNFKGFVGDTSNGNPGEDRGYVIRTDCDLQPKYSLNKEGRTYPVVIKLKRNIIGKLFIEVEDPFLSYIVFELKNKKKICLAPGETISASSDEALELVDLKTNIVNNKGVQAFIKTTDSSKYLVRPKVAVDWDDLNHTKKKGVQYRIDIERDSLIMGSVFVNIDDNYKISKDYNFNSNSKSYVAVEKIKDQIED
ncbi:hypothetical protein GMMP13_20067 [Candidatus Magnetomoraceae bacterium gMMP-13]